MGNSLVKRLGVSCAGVLVALVVVSCSNHQEDDSTAEQDSSTEPNPKKYYFFNDANGFVENSQNVHRRVKLPSLGDAAIRFDMPWEGSWSGYGTLLGKEITGLDHHRLYYACDGAGICLALSTDGFNWRKPNFGIHPHNSSINNNIILKHSQSFTPLIDPRPGVPPDERWKAIANGIPENQAAFSDRFSGLFSYKSKDGINWTRAADTPIISNQSGELANIDVDTLSPRTYDFSTNRTSELEDHPPNTQFIFKTNYPYDSAHSDLIGGLTPDQWNHKIRDALGRRDRLSLIDIIDSLNQTHLGSGFNYLASGDSGDIEEVLNDYPQEFKVIDTHNVVIWDAEKSEFVLYFRAWTKQDLRAFARKTSKDFKTWSKAEMVEFSPEITFTNQLYTPGVLGKVGSPGSFIALSMRHHDRPPLNPIPVIEKYGVSETEFLYSNDGLLFHRFAEPIVRPGLDMRNWGKHSNAVQLGMIRLNEHQMLGLVLRHAGVKNHDPFLQTAIFRPDGFVALQPTDAEGTFTTKAFRLEAENLFLNYSASVDGGIDIEIQHKDGTPISGFTSAHTGDSLFERATWHGDQKKFDTLRTLIGQVIRLKFHLRNAEIYTLQFQ